METRKQTRNTLYFSLFMIGVILASFNMRPAITSVGPLINEIQRDLGLTHGAAGLITSLPIIAFAILSPLVPNIARRSSNSWTLIIGLFILLLGFFVRSVANLLLLFTGTFLIGVGIAILNVILPSIIKDKFPNKFAFMTSVYTTSMGIVASLASGLSVPLAIQLGLGWKLTLLLWAIPTVVALIVWFYLVKFDRKTDEMDKPSQTNAEFKKMWRTPRAWQIALFLGLQSFLFYVTITWLPNILHHFGASRQLAGWLLSFTQLIGLPANFFVPILADRFYKRQEHVALIVSSFSIIGFFLLIISSQAWLFIMSIIFIGLGLSGTFSLALAFVGMRARDAKQAAQLSGMAQSLGYILAAVGPMLIGSLFDLTGAWLVPLIALIIVGLLTAYFGYCSGKDGYVL